MDKMLYTVKEVAGIMHSNTNYVYALIRRGLLPAIKLGVIKSEQKHWKNSLLNQKVRI